MDGEQQYMDTDRNVQAHSRKEGEHGRKGAARGCNFITILPQGSCIRPEVLIIWPQYSSI